MTQPTLSINVPFKPGGEILEVGGGAIPLFHPNMDMRKLPEVDIVANIEERWPIENERYDGVFGKFVIEHVSWRRVPFFIAECYRILKPGGSAMMIGPNTFEQCKEIIRRGKIHTDEASMIFGGQEEPGWNEHKAAFSPDYAKELFTGAGFVKVVTQPWPVAITDMIIYAWKGDVTLDNTAWLKDIDVKMQNNLATRQNFENRGSKWIQ